MDTELIYPRLLGWKDCTDSWLRSSKYPKKEKKTSENRAGKKEERKEGKKRELIEVLFYPTAAFVRTSDTQYTVHTYGVNKLISNEQKK